MLDTTTPCLLSSNAGIHLGRVPDVGPASWYHKLTEFSMRDPHYCWHYQVKYGKFEVPRITAYFVWQQPILANGDPKDRIIGYTTRRRNEYSIVVGEVQNVIDALGQAQALAAPHAVAHVMGLKIPKVRQKRGQIALAQEADHAAVHS